MKMLQKLFFTSTISFLTFISTSCTSLFKKTDPLVEKTATEYSRVRSQIRSIEYTIQSVDKLVYIPVRKAFYNDESDTFTPAYNSLTPKEQQDLLKAEIEYKRIKSQYLELKEILDEFDKISIKTYQDYYTIRNTAVAAEELFMTLPAITSELLKFKK